MPVKSRISKRRACHITDAARSIWLACGPSAIVLVDGGPGFISDAALADALGLPPLLWLPGMDVLVEYLEAGARNAA